MHLKFSRRYWLTVEPPSQNLCSLHNQFTRDSAGPIRTQRRTWKIPPNSHVKISSGRQMVCLVNLSTVTDPIMGPWSMDQCSATQEPAWISRSAKQASMLHKGLPSLGTKQGSASFTSRTQPCQAATASWCRLELHSGSILGLGIEVLQALANI